MDQILETMSKGEAERRLQAMTAIIVGIAVERFGEEQKKSSGTSYARNHRAEKIHLIRREMRTGRG